MTKLPFNLLKIFFFKKLTINLLPAARLPEKGEGI